MYVTFFSNVSANFPASIKINHLIFFLVQTFLKSVKRLQTYVLSIFNTGDVFAAAKIENIMIKFSQFMQFGELFVVKNNLTL